MKSKLSLAVLLVLICVLTVAAQPRPVDIKNYPNVVYRQPRVEHFDVIGGAKGYNHIFSANNRYNQVLVKPEVIGVPITSIGVPYYYSVGEDIRLINKVKIMYDMQPKPQTLK